MPPRRIVPIVQYFVIQASTEQCGGKRISSAVLSTTQPPLRGRKRSKQSLSLGGYVSNARRLNKSGVAPRNRSSWPSMARRWQRNLATSLPLSRGHARPQPPDDQVGDLQVVLVHHQHVAVALVAGLRQQQELGRAAGGLDGVDGRGAAVAALVPVRPGRALA